MEERSACAKFAQKNDNGKDLKALRFLACETCVVKYVCLIK